MSELAARPVKSLRDHGADSFSQLIDRWFPTPQFLLPHACGIDISDASLKWLTLAPPQSNSPKVAAWGDVPLSPGIVAHGIVRDAHALAQVLQEIKPHLAASAAHVALPEEAAYVFSMHVPRGSDRQQILSMIEFEFEGRVPIPPSAAVYDFSVIDGKEGTEGMEVGVTVFPSELATSYAAAFEEAGITLLSFEVEARSIARAVSSCDEGEPITLLVDFGFARTGFAVLKRGIPIFTSTVEVGGNAIMDALMRALSLSPEEAEKFGDTHGLVATSGTAPSSGADAITGTAILLSDEITRHYRYWDTRRNEHGERVTPVGKVVLVGGSANLNGLPEFIAGRVQAPVVRGNIWRHICRFDEYIPPIDYRMSLKFATAAGLALR
ncbi:MAG TPA: pilus assembly protein PilM [Candidatus Paceibacterota bacterium]